MADLSLAFCDVRTALAQRRSDPALLLVISIEADDSPLDSFFTDPMIVAVLQPPTTIVRLREIADADALRTFQATFPVTAVPALFVFGPNSRGHSLAFTGEIPDPSAFARAFVRLLFAKQPAAPAPPRATGGERRRITVTVMEHEAVLLQKRFRATRTVGFVRRWAAKSTGRATENFDLVPLPGGDALTNDDLLLSALDLPLAPPGLLLELRVRQRDAKPSLLRLIGRFLASLWIFWTPGADPAEFWQMKP
jgi:hypothetical protein